MQKKFFTISQTAIYMSEIQICFLPVDFHVAVVMIAVTCL